ncbi:putative high affinity copper protein [Cladorrhinum sp. PSN332]|nr:putative high affinity copper protein [Cladorrhinum sp. PSN332]
MDHGHADAEAACKISMLWNWYTIDACFLSRSWHITSHGAFAATCIGVILMVILLEALRRIGKEYDEHIQRDFAARVALIANGGISGGVASNSSSNENGVCPAAGPAVGSGSGAAEQGRSLAPQTVTFRASPLQQLVRSVIHTATFGLAYIIMLLAMYYNGYVIISILIGALLGKFICDWMTKTVVITAGGDALVKNGNASGIDEPTVCCG